ncbi:MAG: WHG domain-containing protein, partial [Mycobacterium sp.]|nr:WHG domain-containing protein [Mycobacterium sp.]
SQDGGHDPSDRLDDGSGADRAEPYEILRDVLDDAAAAGLLDAQRRPGAEIAAWSAVHGLASLLLDGPLPATGAALEFARSRVLDLIERGLLDGG